jgi:ActR/RegA family two-component response regulator
MPKSTRIKAALGLPTARRWALDQIGRAAKRTGGNAVQTAQALGMCHRTFCRIMAEDVDVARIVDRARNGEPCRRRR